MSDVSEKTVFYLLLKQFKWTRHAPLFLKSYLSLIWVYSISSVEINWFFTGFHSIWSPGT